MSATKQANSPSTGEIVLASTVFIIFSIPAIFASLLSGAIGGSGLFNVEPKFTDYIPLIGILAGFILVSFGAVKAIPPIFMWLAAPLVLITFLISILFT